jgi:hypothetical protein
MRLLYVLIIYNGKRLEKMLYRLPKTFATQDLNHMAPTQEDIQNIMLEATLNAVKLINRFVEK